MSLEHELAHRHVDGTNLERGRDAKFIHASHEMIDGECTSCGMRAKWKGAEDVCPCRYIHERREYDKARAPRRRGYKFNPNAPRPRARRKGATS